MDEHYIEFTAIIGPIGKPHKLHTFDVDGTVNSTVHGDLAERLANAVWEVDHDANISTHVTTQAEMQARADAEAERDRLRAVVDAVREQLGEAVHTAFRKGSDHPAAHRIWLEIRDMPPDVWRDAMDWCGEALLDVSADMGGTESTEGAPHESDGDEQTSAHGAPDPPNGGPVPASTPAPQLGSDIETAVMGDPLIMCRWCHRPIVLLPAEQLPINEPAWVHVDSQPGTGRRNQIQCEPDMQSMVAEPNTDNFWHCRCGTKYDSGYFTCPNCGTARQRTPGSAESWDAAAEEKP